MMNGLEPEVDVRYSSYRGSITGVWISEKKGKPMIIVETTDGKVYMTSAKEVWPGRQIGKEAIDDQD
jgi:hypothetical protein